MFRATVDKSALDLAAVSRHLQIGERFRNLIQSQPTCKASGAKCFDVGALVSDAPEATEWRVIDHCAAITRMYAVFEGFVDAVLREYLSFLNRTYAYAELGDRFRSNYVRGVGLIVSKASKQRYRHLAVNSLATDLAAALSGSVSYRLTPEAMLIQEQNLRLAELERIFAHCGLSGLRAWIDQHPAIVSFFSSTARISDTPEAELRQIVSYRNEAAHGEVDSVLGVAVLTEFAEFILHLCIATAEFAQKDMLTRLASKREVLDVGVVTERFRGNIVVAVLETVALAVGDTIYLTAKYRCMEAKVLSLQLQGEDVGRLEATTPVEVGIKLDVEAKKGMRVLSSNPSHERYANRDRVIAQG